MSISPESLHNCIKKSVKPENFKITDSIASIIFNEAPSEFLECFNEEELCRLAVDINLTLQDSLKKSPHLKIHNPREKQTSGFLNIQSWKSAFPTGPFFLIQSRWGSKEQG